MKVEGGAHSPSDRPGGGENDENDLDKKIHEVLFFLEHHLSESYRDRVQILEEGGYNMAITTPNERLSSVLMPEVEERRELLEGLNEEIISALPLIQDVSYADAKHRIAAYQARVAVEIAQLDTLANVAREVWEARGGPAELATSIAKDPAAQKVIGHLDMNEEAADYTKQTSRTPTPDLALVRNDLGQRLSRIENSTEQMSSFVREVAQLLRAYVDELGRALGTS